jgi:glycosyltransferase involved in cell wall biosynthesis
LTRTALVHHWLVTRGGGERVAEVLAGIFPQAPIFTLLQRDQGTPRGLKQRRIVTSPLQRIPLASRMHRHFLPLYPWAVERLDLRGYSLVIVSDSGPVKGVRLDPNAVEVCYCHAPMRYLWDDYEGYAASMSWPVRAAFRATAGRVRRWDYAAAQRVTHFLANSRNVQARIKKFYGRDSTVLYPPIDTWRGAEWMAKKIPTEDFYLHAGRLVPYKRVDLLIQACNRMGRRLVIAGGGPEEAKLRAMAGPTIEFLGQLDTEQLWAQYARCRALLFGALEDFGMVALEAESCGRPVIAYGAAGSLETMRGQATAEGPATGVWFPEQTVDSVIAGIQQFESREHEFDPAANAAFAQKFDIAHFITGFKQFLRDVLPRENWPEELQQETPHGAH